VPTAKKTETPDRVAVTVTKFGDGRVSTGEHSPESGEVMAKRGAVLEVDLETANALERRGLAEIKD